MIEVDSFYLPASFKTQSQDYALHGLLGDRFVYVIGADGCGSADRADVGARLMAHNMAAAFNAPARKMIWLRDGLTKDARSLRDCAIQAAQATMTQIQSWRGNLTDYLSTLACALFDKNSRELFVMILGDGAAQLLSECEDETRRVWLSHSYTKDMPCYPLYTVHDGLLERYTRESIAIENVEVHEMATIELPGGEWTNNLRHGSSPDGFFDFSWQRFFLGEEATHTVSIFSDGIEKFHAGPSDSDPLMDSRDAAFYLSQFPVRKGEFVKRRLLKRVRGQHYLGDDLFVAGITIDPHEA
jgi:hypothetical protein